MLIYDNYERVLADRIYVRKTQKWAFITPPNLQVARPDQ